MKKILLITFGTLLLLAVGCTQPTVDTFNSDLSAFLQTRSDAPLEGTIWQHRTGDAFDRFILFENGQVSLFYGLDDPKGLQRWSDFYTAPYTLWNGTIDTALEYPLWGEKTLTQKASVVRSLGSFTIDLDGDTYVFYGDDVSGLDEMWMTITVTITPWYIPD
ncbi:MAG: hypothetical protein J5382_11985 [Bacteroidales bacterium]|nr:hypothetical protein [Bacteroidales bacterium]